MSKRSSASSRVAAVAALVVGFVLAVAVLGGALGGGDSGDGGGKQKSGGAEQAKKPKRKAPASYTIKSGDTLIGISVKVGVSVAQIEALNPQVDPQILRAGEKLKLK